MSVFSVRPLPQFSTWLDSLADGKVRGAVAARIKRLEFGLFGDAKSVGGGVFELRIQLGAGWRIYFTRRGRQVIILLAGGSKRTQVKDIERAKSLVARLE